MRKFLALFTCLLFLVSAAAAQSSDDFDSSNQNSPDISTRIIKIDKDYSFYHPTATTVNIELHYTPLTNEVAFNYTCMAASFDQGEAMDTAIAVFLDFQKENQFIRYSYAAKDKVKYFKNERGIKMATYRSLVVFTR